jgi:single-stranded DNA-binding protein
MKQIVIDGRLGKDAVLGTTNTGRQYLRFSLANSSFSKNEGEKTEWFDVTTFSDFDIKYRQNVLKKGSYVIVTGTWRSETSVKDSKVWLNHYVNATDINVPNLGNKKETTVPTVEGLIKNIQIEPAVATPSVQMPTINVPTVQVPTVEARLNAETKVTAPKPEYTMVNETEVDDDLPF